MPYPKTIVCLAASWKHNGTCIAGKEYVNGRFGAWIRPVSNRPGEEINWDERRKDNGYPTNVLDIVTVSLDRPKPHLHQPENHVIAGGIVWQHQKMLNASQIRGAIDSHISKLWVNGFSSGNGVNDRVPQNYVQQQSVSLALIRPEDFIIHAIDEVEGAGTKRRYRASFSLSRVEYNLSITDPWLSKKLSEKNAGRYTVDDPLICVSLGELMSGYAYKLVASVIIDGRRG